jgi:hypothetical protein
MPPSASTTTTVRVKPVLPALAGEAGERSQGTTPTRTLSGRSFAATRSGGCGNQRSFGRLD